VPLNHDHSDTMSTIEPRLIALLNNDTPYESYPSSPSLELPPLQDPNILKASGRPLLLEPDASKRNQKLQHTSLISGIEEDEVSKKTTENSKRALGNSSPQSLRKILDNGHESAPAISSKKRTIESSKDDFVQLPQPPKKQKAAKQVVPPIIIGLFQPPPQATLFPPIASSAFHDSHGRNSLNTVPLKVKGLQERDKPDTAASPVSKKKALHKEKKKKDVKARKKWTEEETNNLLLGVHKHGVGKWSDILDDPSFTFNDRSGVDLKDRFRTCCPAELRSNAKPKATVDGCSAKASKKSKSSLLSENILIDEETFSAQDNGNDEQALNKPRKLRAHRKNVEDLIQLGIDGPFRKSQRRERRPFTDDDDREILEGYQIYGPAWSRIQRDSRFHLQTRQATDLRDRFRNKYPEKFRSDESSVTKNPQSATDTREKENSTAQPLSVSALQPSPSRDGLRIHEMISEDSSTTVRVQPLQSHTSNLGFKDNYVYPEQPVEQADGLPSFDWNPTAPFTSTMGEMDISRLLLDSEPWMENASTTGREKQSFTDINSILTSTSDDLPQISSYYGLLVNEEPLNMPSSVPLDNDGSFA